MLRYILIPIVLIFFLSCEKRKIRYSGIEDLSIGVYQIILYENGEFYLELGAGGSKGTYEISNDTITLNYTNENNWMNKILMTEDYFITIENDTLVKSKKIKRHYEEFATK